MFDRVLNTLMVMPQIASVNVDTQKKKKKKKISEKDLCMRKYKSSDDCGFILIYWVNP